ncbi:hypothetical protein [uncultured Amnibacterium sp.]|uniref:hypothetical protein n=1 Tax=uncultured Amnibacterium sp. TaxID=1631851 RepID=UPI0035CAF705
MSVIVFAAAAAPIEIKWNLFVLVAVSALVVTVLIAVSYAVGLRLLEAAHGGADAHIAAPRPAAMAGAVVCFAIGIAAVLFGLVLVIPPLHSAIFPS